ncbi:GPO family capsid scaffolding protein [Photobacterium sp. DA100]|uniref:GPO family capsid scaffolding protein n=1 Tax=Photobacterium sp. DA100 TaxID=3027472 RepID=UPI002478AA89|nr:GPO family capsid scaffolding protein [Photobacterium sp. DA100]WEM43504.1 GPO family capsid scaffolding protein [Photobacterium sp. DA100]
MAGKLKTGWIRVATEGDTIDGREISRQDLLDMAENYDPDVYGARIWPEHWRWYACGDVLEAKAEEVDGLMRLFAVLAPNMMMVEFNQQDQKVYTSIEIKPNFANTGKPYLAGMAITDQPASLGTDRIRLFSTSNDCMYAQPELLVMDELHEEAGGIRRLFNLFSDKSASNKKEEQPMDKEQFNALTEAIKQVVEGQGQLQDTLQSHFAASGGAQTPPDEPKQPEKPEVGITEEQFSELTSAVTKLAEGQTAMQQQFSQLLEEDHSNTPDVSGGDGFDCNSLV